MYSALLLVLAALSATRVPPQTYAERQDPPALVTILKLGPESVRDTRAVTLYEASADLFGEAFNARRRRFVALIREHGTERWIAAGVATADPGGVFSIRGVRFLRPGEYELLVALFETETPLLGSAVEEYVWRERSVALSQRLAVRVADASAARPRRPDPSGGETSILSFANIPLSADQKTAVPASGNLIAECSGHSSETKVYAVIRVPYTDRAIVFGPAHPGRVPGQCVFPGISLETAGDPQQSHLELSVFATEGPVRTGPVSWDAITRAGLRLSLPVEVVVDARRQDSAYPPLPVIVVAKLGPQPIVDPSRVYSIRNGAAIELVLDGAFEGSLPWLLTREEGDPLWRAQGPALKRAGRWDPLTRRQRIVWVWLDLRFYADDEGPARRFEVVAMLSTALFPNARVDSTFFTSRSVDAISEIVRVTVEGADAVPAAPLSIASIQGARSDGRRELRVGAAGPVVMHMPGGRPSGMRVYAVRHKAGSPTWSAFEAIDRGTTQIVPDFSFTNPHLEEGAEYQVTGVTSWGRLPAADLSYEELLRYVATTSEVVSVRYSRGIASTLSDMLAGPNGTDTHPPGSVASVGGFSRKERSMSIWILLGAVAAAAIIATFLVARRVAQQRSPRFRSQPYFELGVARFLLGLGLLGLILWIIQEHYLPIYAEVLARVMSLDPHKSVDLAIWLISLTALLGIFVDLSLDFSRFYGAKAETMTARRYGWITAALLATAFLLWLFQGALYFEALRFDSTGLVPPLGGVAFVLFAVTETATFFFVSKLVLPSLQTS